MYLLDGRRTVIDVLEIAAKATQPRGSQVKWATLYGVYVGRIRTRIRRPSAAGINILDRCSRREVASKLGDFKRNGKDLRPLAYSQSVVKETNDWKVGRDARAADRQPTPSRISKSMSKRWASSSSFGWKSAAKKRRVFLQSRQTTDGKDKNAYGIQMESK